MSLHTTTCLLALGLANSGVDVWRVLSLPHERIAPVARPIAAPHSVILTCPATHHTEPAPAPAPPVFVTPRSKLAAARKELEDLETSIAALDPGVRAELDHRSIAQEKVMRCEEQRAFQYCIVHCSHYVLCSAARQGRAACDSRA